jgi:hypothetical protein
MYRYRRYFGEKYRKKVRKQDRISRERNNKKDHLTNRLKTAEGEKI